MAKVPKESLYAKQLYELGFKHFNDPKLPSIRGELLFLPHSGMGTLTVAIDETGQHWVHPKEAIDLTGLGFMLISKYKAWRRNYPETKSIN